jgi:hypothetical protein
MDNILLKKYFYIPRCSRELLKKKGFRYSYMADAYRYPFPIYNNGKPVFLCELSVRPDESSKVNINLYYGNHYEYTPFYHYEVGNYGSYLEDINKQIIDRMEKIGIKESKKSKRRS